MSDNPNLLLKEAQGLQILYRAHSSDEKVIEEVIGHHVYEKGFRDSTRRFEVTSGEHWLDLGANIGTFTLFASQKGASVRSYEAELFTASICSKNVAMNGFSAQVNHRAVVADNRKTATLSLGKPGSEWRNSLVKKKTDTLQVVDCVSFQSLITDDTDGVKMDIEGAELEILDTPIDWKNVRKLVFEYHLDIDPLMRNFWRRIHTLEQHFSEVHFGKIDPKIELYSFFPPSRIIYCLR